MSHVHVFCFFVFGSCYSMVCGHRREIVRIVMRSFYNSRILPCCLDMACGLTPILMQREKIVPLALGEVLEIGIGSGLNLPYYQPEKVARIVGVDPDDHSWKLSEERRSQISIPIERIGVSGERIPLDDDSFDSVVITYSLCTIPDPVQALQEAKRLLRPGGRLYFCEHGLAPDAGVAKWQKRIDPFWKVVAGGCHSGRDIPAIFEAAAFEFESLDEMYITRGLKVLSYNYWGIAKVSD